MARTSRKRASVSRQSFQAQDFLLAGMGVASLGRKQAIEIYATSRAGMIGLRSQVKTALASGSRALTSEVSALRKQVDRKVAPFRKQVTALAAEAQATARLRLGPVLARLGVPVASAGKRRRKQSPAARRARRAA